MSTVRLAAPAVAAPGGLTPADREIIRSTLQGSPAVRWCLEVGAADGTGSTLEVVTALRRAGEGRLWTVEADPKACEQARRNLRARFADIDRWWTLLPGLSQSVLPRWLGMEDVPPRLDWVFLDGGNSPGEQVAEFQLLERHVRPGGWMLAHDARLRKGRRLVPYLRALDNWSTSIHGSEAPGLLCARKLRDAPSPRSRLRARLRLRAACLHPADVALALVPSGLKTGLSRRLPIHWVRFLAEGRSMKRIP